MATRIIFQNPTKDIMTVVIPAFNDRSRPEGETADELIARVIAQIVPEGTPRWIVDSETPDVKAFLEDRTFRNAWECSASGDMEVSMSKARVIHMDKIREVRNAELVARDIPFMRAIEAGDTDAQSTIGTEKQVLRDLPATFDITTGVDTPEKLKAKWPTELPARE